MSRLELAYYADDFSGATDVLEVLALHGVRAALFLEPPAPEEVELLGVAAIGVAGNSRTLSPKDMDDVLPATFSRLALLRPRWLHYKTCSTFDSAPHVGSIGHATEIGRASCAPMWTPVVVGAPRLGRYSAFGTLFASVGLDGTVHRLDRHPVMSRHPVTPMSEADLRVVLGAQTDLTVGLVDLVDLSRSPEVVSAAVERELADGAEIVLLDVLTEADLAAAGRVLLELEHAEAPVLVVGSSGIEYALGAAGAWPAKVALPVAQAAPRTVVVSGSASVVTSGQIDAAISNGFVEIGLDLARPTGDASLAREREVVSAAAQAVSAGGAVVVRPGPLPGPGQGGGGVDPVGEALGRILAQIIEACPVDRAVVAGGDTAVSVVRALGVRALEVAAAGPPGSPVCRALAPGRAADGLELVLKGGQIGPVAMLVDLRLGRPLTS